MYEKVFEIFNVTQAPTKTYPVITDIISIYNEKFQSLKTNNPLTRCKLSFAEHGCWKIMLWCSVSSRLALYSRWDHR